jgi:dTDP-4-amino-4,6-dideoxygalactose transaminase
MIRKKPIIGHNITLSDIISGSKGFFARNSRDEFRGVFSAFIHSEHVYFVNSGISAFYIVLETLKKKSLRREVILPAYTAASLVVAVRKAGLEPVLCDIALEDFNMDVNAVGELITSNTLCIVCVHMFGIPINNMQKLKDTLPDDVFLIEDCAQSMGSKINDRQMGSFGDVSIFSFNRGKNLPTYGGGIIVSNSDDLSGKIEKSINALSVPGIGCELSLFIKFIALSVAFRPLFYSLLCLLTNRFREDTVPVDFEIMNYTPVQARLGISLLKQFNASCARRYENGMMITNALKDTEGVLLSLIPDISQPAFNRFPIVVKNVSRKKRIEEALNLAGIENSRMYIKPLHHIFDLGYGKDDFPNALYFAGHLLAIPVHPLLTDADVDKIITIVSETE